MNKLHRSIINALFLKQGIGSVSLLIFFGLFFPNVFSFGQENPKEGALEKPKPRMALVSTQINGDSILLEATVKFKEEGSWVFVDFEPVLFSGRSDTLNYPLGKALTSDKGVAYLKIGVNKLTKDTEGFWNFNATFKGTPKVEEAEAELSIKPVVISLSGEKQDTTYRLTLTLSVPGTDSAALAEAEVGFYVKRHFSNLKIGEGTTDSNGQVTIICPSDLAGDKMGNIILIGRADDLEEYGSVAAFIEKPWGIPIHESEYRTRSLTSHAPPLWMVIVFAILMTTVWGHYIVIVYKLIKLRNSKT